MKWSKLKSVTEQRFADSVRGRVELWTTAYRKPNSTKGRGWITINGDELVNFATPVTWRRFGAYFHESSNTDCLKHPAISDEERNDGNLAEDGEFSRFDLHLACWEMLSLSLEEALKCDNPLIKALAMLDARLGKRRLAELNETGEHPLVACFLRYRKNAEQVNSDHSNQCAARPPP
jgi:hypothetical protein